MVFPGHSLAAVVAVQTQSHKTDILRSFPPPLLLTATPRTSSPPSFPLFSSRLLCTLPLLTYFFLFPPLHLLLSSSHLLHPFHPLTPVLFSPVAQFVPFSSFSCSSLLFSHFTSSCSSSSLFLTFHILPTKCSIVPCPPLPPPPHLLLLFCKSLTL